LSSGQVLNIDFISQKEFNMFSKHMGDAILEWVVLGALVIAVVGIVAYSVASKGSAQGTSLGNWITSIAVPSAHP